MARTWWRLARLLLPAALLVFLVLWLRRMDLGRIWATLRQARFGLFAAAVLLNVLPNSAARVQRWRTLLRPLPVPLSHGGRPAGFAQLAALFFASTAMNNLLPARPGEALRTVRLHRWCGYSVGGLVASQVMERLIETASLGLLALPVIALSATPPGVAAPLVMLAVAAVGAVALALVLARRARPGSEPTGSPAPGISAATAASPTSAGRVRRAVRGFLARVSEAMRLMGTPRTLLASLGWSWVSDLADVAMVGLCLAAVHVTLPVAAWLLVFVAINVAIVVPATPGQLGVFEASAVVVLTLLGVDGSAALSFAVLYHAAHLLPTTIIGLPFYFLTPASRSATASTVSADSQRPG